MYHSPSPGYRTAQAKALLRAACVARLSLLTTLFFGLSSATAIPAQAQFRQGDILVIDAGIGIDLANASALFEIDRSTGARILISNFADSAQGPTAGNGARDVALTASGSILVLTAGGLFSINSTSGFRTLLSDFNNLAQGPRPSPNAADSMAVTASGNILVSSNGDNAVLISINPATGLRTLLSDFKNAAQGPTVPSQSLKGVVVGPAGEILVVSNGGQTGSRGALFNVSPVDGTRVIVSDFNNAASGPLPAAGSAQRVAFGALGRIVMTDVNSSDLFSISLLDGTRTVLSDFDNLAQGPLAIDPLGVAVSLTGSLLIADPGFGGSATGALLSIDPNSGQRTVLSDFGNAAQGPSRTNPVGVVVVPLLCGGRVPTLTGTPGNDVINGGAGTDVMVGLGGNDTLNGLGGNDILCGGAGDDTLNGGIGNDTLLGQAGNDTLNGELGSDNAVFGGITGVIASLTSNTASGEGSDTLSGVENLTGSPGPDSLTGDALNNTLNGGLGNDTLNGAGGIDTVSYAGSSAVVVNLSTGTATGQGSDTLSNLEYITGSSGPDTLTGNAFSNILSGLGGNDTLDGQGGHDFASFQFSLSGVTASLSTNTATGEGSDTLSNFESLLGSNFNDTLTGNASGNFLFGQNGNDSLNGLGGNDTLNGGFGNDALDGGTETDTCNGNAQTTADTAVNCETVTGVP